MLTNGRATTNADEPTEREVHFGDLNDPGSKPNRYLRARTAQEKEQGPDIPDGDEEWLDSTTTVGNVSTFGLLEEIGADPNVVYVGNEPGPTAEQIDGPVPYDALPMAGLDREDETHVDRRKDVTDEGTVGLDIVYE